uniref:Uncharacterized protein n=1 Tax=Arundo donax TaxID=35708 RepID=A0A0A9D8A4_ARUDO
MLGKSRDRKFTYHGTLMVRHISHKLKRW